MTSQTQAASALPSVVGLVLSDLAPGVGFASPRWITYGLAGGEDARADGMNCVCCGSASVAERPEVTARAYRQFRCRACGRQFNAAPIPLEPDRLRRCTHSVRRDRGQIVQGSTQRLGHQFEQMQVVHGSQHVCAVGALLAARLDQTAGLETLQHRVQQ